MSALPPSDFDLDDNFGPAKRLEQMLDERVDWERWTLFVRYEFDGSEHAARTAKDAVALLTPPRGTLAIGQAWNIELRWVQT